MMPKTFVGFGFGPIQSALFLYEAYRSGNFGRYVVAEVDPVLVKAVRAAGGRYALNIARPDRIDPVEVAGVELYNPRDPVDRAALIDAIAGADELATALPSVKFFDAGGEASVARLLAEGWARREAGRPAILYAAENHNHAAEILTAAVGRQLVGGTDKPVRRLVSGGTSPAQSPLPSPEDRAWQCHPLRNVQVLNTVIGKMSGVITDAPTLARLKLAPITPTTLPGARAVLVEEFNRILVSRVTLPGFRPGIEVFEEKPDLLPFEEAKLYGHNAIHALIGYLADLRGLTTMADAAAHPDLLATARAAFLNESGVALIRKYGHLGEELFTPAGYQAYADDLLQRMTNPHLNDLVARVIRDPVRKLGYDDRLYGAMRLALQQGITPVHLAQGAAAAVRALLRYRDELPAALAGLPADPGTLDQPGLAALLRAVWAGACDAHADTLIALTWQALRDPSR